MKNYEQYGGSCVEQPDLFNAFNICCLSSNVVPSSTYIVAATIRREFPQTSTKKCRRKLKWATMTTAYTNMRHRNITLNVMNITDIFVQTGFFVVTFKPKVRATLTTHLLVDNRALCKELQIDESRMVQAKTGGHEVPSSLLPQSVDMNDMDDITTLAKQVADMQQCMGFSILGKDGPQYWWSMVEECGSDRFHGRGAWLGCLLVRPTVTPHAFPAKRADGSVSMENQNQTSMLMRNC